jgi:SnoaL-like domain
MMGGMSTTIPVDAAGHSPFRAAIETKDFSQVAEVLAPDVHFRSPVVFAPIIGREAVGALLTVVGQVLGGPDFSYEWQVHEGDREVLNFRSRVGQREVEGVDLIRYDEEGLVAELVVMMRPASALSAVQVAIASRLSAAG